MAKDDEKKELSRIDIEYTSKFVSATDSDQALRKGPQEEEFVPPDGGWGWVVCITSLLTNGTAFSILNTFGIIYVYLIKEYANGDPEISFKTSWVGSVCTGVTFLMCIFASICSDRIGIRPTAFFGAALGVIGLISSAFITQLELLYLTYGILLGTGGGFVYSPSLVILGHYFKKHMGIVNGIVAFGSSIYTIVLSIVLPIVLESLGIKYTFLILGGLYCLPLLGTLTWKPLFHRETSIPELALSKESIVEHVDDCCSWTKEFLNLKIFKNRAYLIWFLGLSVALFGYFVPFVHLVKHTQDNFPTSNAFILITCMQVTSGVGRLLFGKLADLEWVNRIYMQQTAFVVMGVVTACIPFSASFEGLIAICLILGICDGIFVCLLGPIAFDIVGPMEASQAIGFMLGGFSIPFTVGPPIAGLLYDKLHTYEVAFVAAGVPPIVGAIMMCLIPRVKQSYPAVTETHTFASFSMLDVYHASTSRSAQLNQLNQVNGVNPHQGTTSELEVVRIVELPDPKDLEGTRLLDSQNNDIKYRRNNSGSSNVSESDMSQRDSESLLGTDTS
ncbi:monocarboxylate transporter 10-like [Ostrea edulis]|uniref:monocarboxylate transporter 10-like n=1 Tax=Ostrea edulis TaxID=37623 RepID=UPI0024AFAEF4|nr:monocarboxylate transporter 10-like [Ostrea edulis]XP_056015728.1 monocarboxylate transporter 10-like [Ostrea edulis]